MLGPLHQDKFVGECALEQYAHAIVTREVGRRDERPVLSDTKVNQVADLGQDEKVPSHWILNLGEFLAEVLDEDVVQGSAELDRLLANELEALIESTANFLREERPRLQGFFYVRVLHLWDDFFKDLACSLVPLPQVA